jgi:4'-phosphopantetheinyl transferase
LKNWQSQDSEKTLGDNEIHIWLSYLNLHQARLKHLYPLLSSTEKERSERFNHYKHRKNYIASHGFLHTVLSYYIDIPASEIAFSHGEQGKPSIIDEQNSENIQFNLSHSGNLAILAICKNHQLGVDIEHTDRKADWAGIARRFFTANEQQDFFQLNESIQEDAFYKVWTRKEAHMKVTGKGLHLPPTQFEISIPPKPAEFIGNLKSDDNNYYKMMDIDLPDIYNDYHASLSANFDFQPIKSFIHS